METASLEEWNRITISVKLVGSNFSRILRQHCIAEADMNLFDRFFALLTQFIVLRILTVFSTTLLYLLYAQVIHSLYANVASLLLAIQERLYTHQKLCFTLGRVHTLNNV